jgi:hypothetical protein
MRLRLILLGTAVAVVLAVAAGWHLRNELIQRLSGPILEEYGMSISDVSLSALATRDATVSYLELVHESGTTIAIHDLSLPFLADEAGLRSYRAGQVTILTSTRDEDVPFEMAYWIEQLLALPGFLAGSDVVIDRLEMSAYPPVSNIHWVLAAETQALSATIAEMPLSVAVAQISADRHDLFLSTVDATIDAALERSGDAYSIRGNESLTLTDWVPLVSFLGILPTQVRIDAGVAEVDYAISIPFDTNVAPSIALTAVPTSPWSVVYGEGEVTAQIAAAEDSFAVQATFPEVSWSVRGSRAGLTVGSEDWQGIPVMLTDIACDSGIRCTMAANVSMSEAILPVGVVATFEGSSMLALDIGDEETRAGIEPGARLRITGLSGEAIALGALDAQLVSAATLTLGEAGWSFLADSVDGQVEGLALADSSTVTAAIYLENFSARSESGAVGLRSGIYTPSSKIAVPGTVISAPGFRGTVSMQGDVFRGRLETAGLNQEATIEVLHDANSGVGRVSLAGGGISFGRRTLAQRFSPWSYPWSLSAGTMTVSLDADWRLADETVAATSTVDLTDLAGFYNDIAFTGLSTRLQGAYDSAAGFAIDAAELSLALVDVGLPVENISARYRLDANELSVDVESLRMEAFGGVIRADPFSFHTSAERNNLVLNVERMDLVELLSMQDFEAINVAGRINAVLPITIAGDRIIVEGGTLIGEAPGGRIRYNPGPGSEPEAGSAIALATQALGNFEFDTLTSAVDYAEGGDLKLQMKLTGRNPDLDSQRPVVLNLGVETNIPEMLRSLQAARTVEDIIKKRAEQ